MKHGLHYLLALPLLIVLALPVHAEIQTKTIPYQLGDEQFEGYLAWDDAVEGRRPGVLVVHEWWGLNDYIRQRTRMLAELGYVAFALDMYGKGRVTEHAKEAEQWLGQVTANIETWQKRAARGLEVLRQQEQVAANDVAAVGYCFGGATVMQLAYSGADVKGVVSFHGSLPIPQGTPTIRARVFAAHGNADAFVSPDRLSQFKTALEQANADWFLVSYGGARHAFTNPEAGAAGIENLRYNADADRRSWQHMRQFLNELFEPAPAARGGSGSPRSG